MWFPTLVSVALAATVGTSGALAAPHRKIASLLESANSCVKFDDDATVRQNVLDMFAGVIWNLRKFDMGAPTAPKKQFAYFKTHKTGSSTLQAMFINAVHRLELHSINSVIDSDNHIAASLGCPETLMNAPAFNGSFDAEFRHVISTHTFLGSSRIDQCYSLDGGFFDNVVKSYEFLIKTPLIVTSFRDPVSQFVSSFGYYSYKPCHGEKQKSCSPAAKLARKRGYVHSLDKFVRNEKGEPTNVVFNTACRDFGLVNHDHVEHFIEKYLSSGKMFVIVLERLFESLVALRRTMNWKFQDILHLHANAAPNGRNMTVTNATLMQDVKAFLRKHMTFDYEIYDAARRSLNDRVEAMSSQDPLFQVEVDILSRITKNISMLCGCPHLLTSNEVAAAKHEFDLHHFCNSFGAREVVREASAALSAKAFATELTQNVTADTIKKLHLAAKNKANMKPLHIASKNHRAPPSINQPPPKGVLPAEIENGAVHSPSVHMLKRTISRLDQLEAHGLNTTQLLQAKVHDLKSRVWDKS